MGFPYPGGLHVDQNAQQGNPLAFKLPKSKMEGNPYDFSFSGLKTYVVNLLHHADQIGEAEQVQFFTELAVVTGLGLFLALQVFV